MREPDRPAKWSVPILLFSSDRGEPRHVHVKRDRKLAKFWLAPPRLAYSYGFSESELKRITDIIQKTRGRSLQGLA